MGALLFLDMTSDQDLQYQDTTMEEKLVANTLTSRHSKPSLKARKLEVIYDALLAARVVRFSTFAKN